MSTPARRTSASGLVPPPHVIEELGELARRDFDRAARLELGHGRVLERRAPVPKRIGGWSTTLTSMPVGFSSPRHPGRIGAEIFELIQKVAAGASTKSEALGHQEFILGYKSFEPLGPSCLPDDATGVVANRDVSCITVGREPAHRFVLADRSKRGALRGARASKLPCCAGARAGPAIARGAIGWWPERRLTHDG
jgi:hypothetical protein